MKKPRAQGRAAFDVMLHGICEIVPECRLHQGGPGATLPYQACPVSALPGAAGQNIQDRICAAMNWLTGSICITQAPACSMVVPACRLATRSS